MSFARISLLTLLAMTAFAGNSLLCRMALKHTAIDAASFTTIRLCCGALMLWLLVSLRSAKSVGTGNWRSGAALFVYAGGFSYAYLSLPAATGALLLFGAVQATMIGYGVACGERLRWPQLAGLLLALGGLVGLLLPGLSAPPAAASMMMLAAGVAWGVYSLRGKGAGDATRVSAGNFLRALPIAVALNLLVLNRVTLDGAGIGYAVASGALASALGYAVWYTVLPALRATQAATVQLSVPVFTALGGVLFLGEALSARQVLASVAILGGIALVILEKKAGTGASPSQARR
jgi:drug/metabolite transporter (DMT)-like permease